ncbi:hypothetical protein HW115_02685 [Verrucomicrobiaceae bacterium N1E253]|uniref:Neurotransmitter-gated ion-channel ligand-binding domain-containing protein n=1 Tax=Oceaniferula marina TaxID=2748318 RepID=A0A851GFH3_9BACT|nr:hypothetical protein [Oceaniferula marina]NWK54501.1 hypothetical protein [Oceaniferula marina]
MNDSKLTGSNQRLRCPIGMVVSVLALWLSSMAMAEDLNMKAPAESVEVKVGAYMIDLIKIDGAEQMFNADIAVRIEWNDPRLADASAPKVRKMSFDDIWHPRLGIANYRDVKTLLPKLAEVSQDGTVLHRQRITGDFTTRMDLRNFPLDEQSLGVQIVSQGYSPDEVVFVVNEKFTGRPERLTISDWEIGDVRVLLDPYEIPRLGDVAGVRLGFDADRHVNYYVATILVSAIIIVCMAWMVFWMPPEAINPRISISVTSMLTLIAHRFVVGRELPRLSYLTKMDMLLLGATVMVLLGLIGVVTVARVSARGRPEMGLKLNGIFRWIYPIVFCVILALLS